VISEGTAEGSLDDREPPKTKSLIYVDVMISIGAPEAFMASLIVMATKG
jgi:hypothetical protein